jgi:hypothetical protein
MKTLSHTLQEIEALSMEIQKADPVLFEQLKQNPIPLPEAFRKSNNPEGLINYFEHVKSQLSLYLINLQKNVVFT